VKYIEDVSIKGVGIATYVSDKLYKIVDVHIPKTLSLIRQSYKGHRDVAISFFQDCALLKEIYGENKLILLAKNSELEDIEDLLKTIQQESIYILLDFEKLFSLSDIAVEK
jgi:hypothetical protein